MYVCTFFGHRDAPKEIEPILRSTLINLIENQNTTVFYVGNQGNFDNMVGKTLKTLKEQNYTIQYYTVLANLEQNEQKTNNIFPSLFPEGLECVPRKFAISWRNRWMIEHADTVVTYVTRPFGGAAQFKEMALKKDKKVVELSKQNK